MLVSIAKPQQQERQFCSTLCVGQFSKGRAEVGISIGEQQITSIFTARSAREMSLKAGQTAAALIKSTEVMNLRV
jgi:molybdopterin-binding protein